MRIVMLQNRISRLIYFVNSILGKGFKEAKGYQGTTLCPAEGSRSRVRNSIALRGHRGTGQLFAILSKKQGVTEGRTQIIELTQPLNRSACQSGGLGMDSTSMIRNMLIEEYNIHLAMFYFQA